VPLLAAGSAVFLRARVDNVENGKKVFLSGEMLDGATGELQGEAKGLWISMDVARLMNTPAASKLQDSPPKIPIGRVSMPGSGAVTTLGAKLTREQVGWVLDNDRRMESGSGESRFRYYLDSERLRRDLLWNPCARSFHIAVAFTRRCQGPPGRVHGGCLFATLDDAITMFLYAPARRTTAFRLGSG